MQQQAQQHQQALQAQQTQHAVYPGGQPQGFTQQQLAAAYAAAAGLHKLAGQAPPLARELPPPKPPTDLERFLAQITPVLTDSRPEDAPLRLVRSLGPVEKKPSRVQILRGA